MSTTSSIITTLGAGSGIDMTALATNLANAQFELRATRLAARSDTLERQISAAGSLKNSLTLLSSALGERVRTGDLASTPQVASSAVATASTPAGTVGSGSYTLEVLSLATSQTLASPAKASATSTVGSGTLTFRFGTATGSSFTEDSSKTAVTIDVASGATLADVAKAINAKNAGLNAYVAQTTQGAQLVVKGQDGAQNGFIIEAGEDSADPGLSDLAWNPSSGGQSNRLLSQSADAQFKLDGLAMTSASNNVGTVAPGLALKLTGVNAGSPTTISFSESTTGITSAMQDLVGALNEIVGDLAAATDPTNGDLAGDPGARALKRTLSGLSGQIVMPNAADGAPRTLADLGLSIQRDGTFRLDTTRLKATLERDPAGAAAMFTNGLYGVYATVDKVARTTSASTDPGSLAGSITRYQRQSKQASKDASKLADQQEALRASMVARFAKTDARVSASKSTLSFLQAQIDAWNSQKN